MSPHLSFMRLFIQHNSNLFLPRLRTSPCLQVKGQIFVERQCQSSPSCRCGRRCLQCLCLQKHPAGTWVRSAVQAGCVWTYIQGHLEKKRAAISEDMNRRICDKVKVKYLPPLFRSSSTFSDRILTFFFFSSCMITLLLGAGWHKQKSIYGKKNNKGPFDGLFRVYSCFLPDCRCEEESISSLHISYCEKHLWWVCSPVWCRLKDNTRLRKMSGSCSVGSVGSPSSTTPRRNSTNSAFKCSESSECQHYVLIISWKEL